ncbi:MAG: hypothetical protein MZV63_07025 [Marinilabiliales bacterium]|nr:hypothetical protein [Marinilabiliales bacterium]
MPCRVKSAARLGAEQTEGDLLRRGVVRGDGVDADDGRCHTDAWDVAGWCAGSVPGSWRWIDWRW